MRRWQSLLLFSLLGAGVGVRAQPIPPQDVSTQKQPPPVTVAPGERAVSWRLLAPNIAHDQKTAWLFPGQVVRGRHWKPALALTAAAAGIVLLDPHDTPYFRRTSAFDGFNRVASGRHTGIGVGTLPLAFYLASFARHDAYGRPTALLAGEALADSELVALAMKNIDRRLRPRDIPPDGDFKHTWFRAGDGVLVSRGAFPSGHAAGAFALATVFSRRYARHRWVPWVAYGLAGTVGFSRITLQAHFPSDVFAGAALGYVIGHYVVLQQR